MKSKAAKEEASAIVCGLILIEKNNTKRKDFGEKS